MLTFEYSAANPRMPVAYGAFEAMHTRCEVLLPGLEKERAETLATRIEQEVIRLEGLFNRFDPDSELGRVNRLDAQGSVAVGEELYGALELCLAFHRSTEGFFDIAVQSSVRPPGAAFGLDPAAHTVRLASPEVVLDLGGFAKGYALERIGHRLRQAGVNAALVNLGDSSVLGLGRHPYGEGWPAGIEDPCRAGEQAAGFTLHDGALSVSGHPPGRAPHIIAREGGTVRRSGFVAVQGRSPLVAEILSTALFAAPEDKRRALLSEHPGYRAVRIRCQPQAPAIVSEI